MQKYILLLALVILGSCSMNERVKLEGKIENAGKVSKVFLYEQQLSSSKLLDSSKLGDKGEFYFKIKTNEPRFYMLRIGKSGLVYLLLSPGEKANISADASMLKSTVSISGSPGSNLILELNRKHDSVLMHLDSLKAQYKHLMDQSASKDQLSVLENDYLSTKMAEHKNVIRFIIENYKSMASIMALYLEYDSTEYVLEYPKDLQYYKIVSDTLLKIYPSSKHVRALKTDFDKMMTMQKSEFARNLMKIAKSSIPEIALPNAKGDTIRITSFLGKIIILNFWSSQCTDCLMINRDYIELYKKFKKSGLVIYQVALDSDKDKWLAAAKDIPWTSVAEITSEKPYYATLYNVTQIPASYLIDQKGNIAGKNLSAVELDRKISSLLKK